MDFNRTWLLALRFGYHPYGGPKLKHIEIEALFRKLRSRYDMLHKHSTSKVLMILFKWYHHASGIIHPVLENPPEIINYVK